MRLLCIYIRSTRIVTPYFREQERLEANLDEVWLVRNFGFPPAPSPSSTASCGRYLREPCSNQFVAAPGVVKLNSSGLMSQRTKTERFVHPGLNADLVTILSIFNHGVHRTTSVTASTRRRAVGRRTRMFIGMLGMRTKLPLKGRRK